MPLFIFMLHLNLRCGQAQNEICYHSTHVDNWQLSLRVNTLCGAPDSCCKSQWQHFFCHYSRDRDIVNQTSSFWCVVPQDWSSAWISITIHRHHSTYPPPGLTSTWQSFKVVSFSFDDASRSHIGDLNKSTNQLGCEIFPCDAMGWLFQSACWFFLFWLVCFVFHFLSDLLKMANLRTVGCFRTNLLPTTSWYSHKGKFCWVHLLSI